MSTKDLELWDVETQKTVVDDIKDLAEETGLTVKEVVTLAAAEIRTNKIKEYLSRYFELTTEEYAELAKLQSQIVQDRVAAQTKAVVDAAIAKVLRNIELPQAQKSVNLQALASIVASRIKKANEENPNLKFDTIVLSIDIDGGKFIVTRTAVGNGSAHRRNLVGLIDKFGDVHDKLRAMNIRDMTDYHGKDTATARSQWQNVQRKKLLSAMVTAGRITQEEIDNG